MKNSPMRNTRPSMLALTEASF